MDLICRLDSSTQTRPFKGSSTSFAESQNYPSIQSRCSNSGLFSSLINFGRAKHIYSESIENIFPGALIIKNNLERLDKASQLLVESNERYREIIAEEDQIYGDVLEEDFFLELLPIKIYKVEAKMFSPTQF